MCLSSVFLWFLGRRRILVTRRTSEIYSGCPVQQPASNSSSSRGKECRLSGGLGRMIADPVGGSGDDGSPVSWVVEERERSEESKGQSDWGHDAHERERKEGEWKWWWWWCWGGWRHLVWCQSNQLSGMPHSRRSTPRCFLSPPTHIHHPAAHPHPHYHFFSINLYWTIKTNQ